MRSLVTTYGLTGTHLDEKVRSNDGFQMQQLYTHTHTHTPLLSHEQVGSMTVLETFNLAAQADSKTRQEISERPMLSGAIIGLDPHNTTVMNHIFWPWLECAAKDGCYNPPGSNKKNHRQDQSALSKSTADKRMRLLLAALDMG